MGHGQAHAHAHGHGDAPRRELESVPVRRALNAAVVVIALMAAVGVALWWPGGDPAIDRQALGFTDKVEAVVTASEQGPCPSMAPTDPGDPAAPTDPADPAAPAGPADPAAPESEQQFECIVVSARLTSGPDAGTTAVLESSVGSDTVVSRLRPGDEIVLDDAGADVPAEARYSFADSQRSTPLVVLAALFALVVVALGRLKGVLALAGIGLSMGVLLLFIFPALLDGAWPVGVALTGATVIAFCTLYLAHGINDRTTVAFLGTMASLALTALLAIGFSAAAELSGLASEESLTLSAFAPDLDFRGLLLAAVIIGTLGVLDDVTITQVSSVWELHHADPAASARQLYGAGIRIGRDHIASTVNTLVLAYAAAAMPLLLIFTQSGLAFAEVLTTETVAVEIVQTLVGSIGLVASVPLTTALACVVIARAAGPSPRGPRGPQVPAGPGYDQWPDPRQPVPQRPDPQRPDPQRPDPRRADPRQGWRPPPAPRQRRAPDPNDDEFWTNSPW